MDKMWGFRTKYFLTSTPGYKPMKKLVDTTITRQHANHEITIWHVVSGLGLVLARFYIATLIFYLFWNKILIDKVDTFKAINGFEAIVMVFCLNYFRIPRPTFLDTLNNLMTKA